MKTRSFEEIMEEIKKGLTHDVETDVEYLQEQSDKYKTHEFGREISRECTRMIYDLLPRDGEVEIVGLWDEYM